MNKLLILTIASEMFAILSDYLFNNQKDEKKYSLDTLTYYWRLPTSLFSYRPYEQPLCGR
ncbi:hypothetical protein [Priestia megaterium]|uniref:hypothetical protein n=1 Tax=Priestia megaterium TaxID=1404 RepID=UPI0025A4734F|nr:hypothetical protein [Priestia megaterium]MDM8147272.1 hypothetical protein [Priestia megaterium]